MSFSSIPLVFGSRHDFNLAQSGAVFAAMCVGSIMATGLSLFVERVVRTKELAQGGDVPWNPERRLYLTCFASILMPIGMFWYGWYVCNAPSPSKCVLTPQSDSISSLTSIYPAESCTQDVLHRHPVDSPHPRSRHLHNGHLLCLPLRLQLPSRHLWAVRQQRSSRPVLLPQHIRRRPPPR